MDISQITLKAGKDWESLTGGTDPFLFVGNATCGRSAGSVEILELFRAEKSNRSLNYNIIEAGCIGMCYLEPIVGVHRHGFPTVLYGKVSINDAIGIFNSLGPDQPLYDKNVIGTLGKDSLPELPDFFSIPVMKPQVRLVLRNCGLIDPTNPTHYFANMGYSGLVKTLSLTPQEIIEEVRSSGLRGRGGAGFPTFRKWQFCRDIKSDTKYLVCNADEGDPGAFMNRSLIEGDPHTLLEGMIIAGYAIGANTGYIYCRAEYPLALERLQLAIKQAEEYNLLGDNILESGFEFHIKIKEGAGAFVCGEETALIASIEGHRGMPRPRPPFPAVSGLWGKPTVINNVESLASVARIFQYGAEWFSKHGTGQSKGTKTFALVGKVKNTGLIEVPLGISLREIIFDIGGGVAYNKEFKAVQTGGPSGGCIPAELLDIPVDYDSLRQAGSIMGSGGLVVMDENTCMVDVARYFLDFARKESCGKCTPCRLGTKQMLDILEDICAGKGSLSDIELLEELSKGIIKGSLCGLGQTAPNPVVTTLRYFRHEYEEHIKERKCRSLVCKELIYYDILPVKCTGCHICFKSCPVDAISGKPKMLHIIDQDLCIKCGMCMDKCPVKFSAIEKYPGKKILEETAHE